ncbi:MAG: hypothetical protein CUN56_08410 [Phototrophicales bacterium]|nr:MAG: hypothetical protein CUN56_08410 [Phototrophicales bacterium]
MQDSLEFTGETIDEAVAKGLKEMGVASSDVVVEVLEEPSRGVFGIGARPARVRLKLLRPPTPPRRNVLIEDAIDEDEDEEDEGDYHASLAKEISEPTEEGAVAQQVLTELLKRMNIRHFRVVVRRADIQENGENPPWILDITGKNVSHLIGRRGETLNALQYITRLITSKQIQRRANIVVDVDGYKAKRSERLEQLANRMADQAVRQNRTVYLEPMPPNERRIIHMTLRHRTDVETKSQGEGESRKVTIIPIQQ